MKAKVTIIEVDDVSSDDMATVLGRVFGFQPAPLSPALPPAEPATPPPAHLPPSVPTQIARLSSGYRPGAGRKAGHSSAHKATGTTNDPRPVTTEKRMCGACGEDAPEGQDFRSSCPKCHTKQWEKVPAHEDLS